MSRACGPCTLCCRFYGVPEIAKPAGRWCGHCSAAGCGIHATRPQSCRNFECFWLMEEALPDAFRPDLCGVVAAFNGEDHESVVLHLDPYRLDALAVAPGAELLAALLASFGRVYVVCGEERLMLDNGRLGKGPKARPPAARRPSRPLRKTLG